MSKYYTKKPIEIKAEPYIEGMEDGFQDIKINQYSNSELKKMVQHLEYLTFLSEELHQYKVPYI